MRARDSRYDAWDDGDEYAGNAYDGQYAGYDDYSGEAGGYDDRWGGPDSRALVPDADAQGLMLQEEQSLVNVSSTITQHGAPLLSYTRTMNRFYTNRKQRLSLGRFRCEVCKVRIRLWAWETENGKRTHDGCYERLAWTWTNLYAVQQRMAAEGRFE